MRASKSVLISKFLTWVTPTSFEVCWKFLYSRLASDSSLLTNPISHGYVGPSTQKALNKSLELVQLEKPQTTEPIIETETKPILFVPKTQEDMILMYLYKIEKKFSSQDWFRSMLNNWISIIDEKLKDTSLTVKQRLFILDLKGAVYRYLENN